MITGTRKQTYTHYATTFIMLYDSGKPPREVWSLTMSDEIFTEEICSYTEEFALIILTGIPLLNVDTDICLALFNFGKIFNNYRTANFYSCFIHHSKYMKSPRK